METSRPIIRWVHLFVENDDQYVFLRNLGSGIQSQAQVVQSVRSGLLLTRKVPLKLLTAREINHPNAEITALKHLQKHATQKGIWPNIVRLFHEEIVAADSWSPFGPKRFFHITHMSFCNAGDLYNFYQRHLDARPRQAVPVSFMFLLIRQVLEAIEFMQSCEPPVFHNDLNLGNILLELQPGNSLPDFILCDFGEATLGARRSGDSVSDTFMLYHQVDKLSRISAHRDDRVRDPEFTNIMERLFELGKASSVTEKASSSVARRLAPLQKFIASLPSKAHLHGLNQTLGQVSLATTSVPGVEDVGYASPTECRQTSQVVHGPWHVAAVSKDPRTEELAVLRIGDEVFHQPEPPTVDSDQQWEMI